VNFPLFETSNEQKRGPTFCRSAQYIAANAANLATGRIGRVDKITLAGNRFLKLPVMTPAAPQQTSVITAISSLDLIHHSAFATIR